MEKRQPKRLLYQAVSIHPAIMGACPGAHALHDQRFLASEAPELPLENCSNPANCRCTYQYWDDRRQEDRRSPFPGIAADLNRDRRTGKDRRSS